MTRQDTLKGLKVLVTRSSSQAHELSALLRDHGAEPIEVALIELSKPVSWEALDNALLSISSYDWVVFASINAVKAVLERANERGVDLSRIAERRIAAIGSSTSEYLRSRGIEISFQPSSFVAEQFVEEFPGKADLGGTRILWPRTNVGRTLIADSLKSFGANVDTVEVYRTELPANSAELSRQITALIEERSIQLITLASAQTSRNLASILRIGLSSQSSHRQEMEEHSDDQACAVEIEQLLCDTTLATIGPITSKCAERYLKPVAIEAREHTLAGLVQAIVEWYQARL